MLASPPPHPGDAMNENAQFLPFAEFMARGTGRRVARKPGVVNAQLLTQVEKKNSMSWGRREEDSFKEDAWSAP